MKNYDIKYLNDVSRNMTVEIFYDLWDNFRHSLILQFLKQLTQKIHNIKNVKYLFWAFKITRSKFRKLVLR